MDAELAQPIGLYGLNVPGFARQWEVSTKTVHRDLAAFKQLGQRMVHKPTDDGSEVRDVCWHYEPGVEPLFLCNLSERVRKAVKVAMGGH